MDLFYSSSNTPRPKSTCLWKCQLRSLKTTHPFLIRMLAHLTTGFHFFEILGNSKFHRSQDVDHIACCRSQSVFAIFILSEPPVHQFITASPHPVHNHHHHSLRKLRRNMDESHSTRSLSRHGEISDIVESDGQLHG